VIGGGISGLSAAHALASCAAPVEVVLLESGNRLGGVLETTHRDGFLIEAAADNFLTTPPFAVELCRAAGIEGSLIGTDAEHRQTFVVRRGRLQPIPPGFVVMSPSRIGPMLRTPVLSLRGKLRVGMEYFISPKAGNEDESLASFVRRRFGREMFERLVQPLVGGIYAADSERLSIAATMPRFREMEQEHGSLIRAALKQRRTQSPETGSGARYGHFATLRRGISALVAALAERLPPAAACCASPVHDLVPLGGDRWSLSIGGERPRRLEVDAVIVATPAHVAARLLARLDSAAADDLAQIEYSSCAVVSLGYRRDQIKHPLNGFGFVVPLIEERTILSCSFASVKYEGRAPAGHVLLRVFIGGACQRGLLRLPADQLMQLAEREVADLLNIEGKPMLREMARHHRAMPQYHVGHRDRVAAITRRLARFPTLALAGNAYEGVGIPACVQSGAAAANRILPRLIANVRSTRFIRAQAEARV
jgi:oxygen-dependent protoporphyrinogen oxidase